MNFSSNMISFSARMILRSLSISTAYLMINVPISCCDLNGDFNSVGTQYAVHTYVRSKKRKRSVNVFTTHNAFWKHKIARSRCGQAKTHCGRFTLKTTMRLASWLLQKFHNALWIVFHFATEQFLVLLVF